MSDFRPESFDSYARRCWLVFAVVVCSTLLMVGTSYAPLSSQGLRISLILAVAVVNAALVAIFLMHLLSERRTIYTLLGFTAVFFVGLMGLSIWASHDLPGALKH